MSTRRKRQAQLQGALMWGDQIPTALPALAAPLRVRKAHSLGAVAPSAIVSTAPAAPTAPTDGAGAVVWRSVEVDASTREAFADGILAALSPRLGRCCQCDRPVTHDRAGERCRQCNAR